MHIADALAVLTGTLLEREVLLGHALGQSRTWIIARPEFALTEEQEQEYALMLKRRGRGEPVAYITGRKEFFGRDFLVDASTLVPRPATELLVEQALRILRGEPVERAVHIDTDIVAWAEIRKDASGINLVADVGTGSGCIAVTLACENPNLHCIATDISGDALEIAKKNAEQHNVSDRIIFKQGDGFDPLMNINQPFLLVSNPPYIPNGTLLETDVKDFEPHAALFAGEKGIDVINPLIAAARNHPLCVGFIIECKEDQVQ